MDDALKRFVEKHCLGCKRCNDFTDAERAAILSLADSARRKQEAADRKFGYDLSAAFFRRLTAMVQSSPATVLRLIEESRAMVP